MDYEATNDQGGPSQSDGKSSHIDKSINSAGEGEKRTCEDTSYLPIPMKANEADDVSEDIVKDVRETILSKHLGEKVY